MRFVIVTTARTAFGPTVCARGRIVGVKVGAVDATNAANAVALAVRTWPELKPRNLSAVPEGEVDAIE